MLIKDILNEESTFGNYEIQIIKNNCSQFLKESAGLPLVKLLPTTYSDFQKVKVRHQRHNDDVTEVFDNAFGQHFNNLRQRAIFAYGLTPTITEGTELFYVFPINGFKFLYSKEVTNSNNDYKRVIDTLIEQIGDEKTTEIVTDLLKYNYLTTNLHEGIVSDSEIILYNVPYYYVIRTSSVDKYQKFLI